MNGSRPGRQRRPPPSAEGDAPTPSVSPDDSTSEEPPVGPFSDHGQFGVDHIDTRVLWQTDVWVDRTGTPHALHDMSPEYVANVITYLYGRAPEWHLEVLLDAVVASTTAVTQDAEPPSQKPCLDQLRNLLALDPRHWIDDTPLMGALRAIR